CGNGEYNRDVTTTVPEGAEDENSTAPREFGVLNKLTQISSNDLDSRGANVNVLDGCDPNRYTAVTFTLAVYDVLNTRTSEKNGAPPCPCTDAATGNVTVSPRRTDAQTERKTAAVIQRNKGYLPDYFARYRLDETGRGTVDALGPGGRDQLVTVSSPSIEEC